MVNEARIGAGDLSAGFYKRRRGILEHLEAGAISLLDLAVHDYLNLKANLVIGNGSSIPAGVCITSATAIHSICPTQISERAIQRSLEHLTEIGWIRRWNVRGKRGNYPVLVCRASVHDLSGKEYRVNGEETTDWRSPKYEPVGDVSALSEVADAKLSGVREVRRESREKETTKSQGDATKPVAPPPQIALVISLPLNDGSEYPITEKQVSEWRSLYPAVDVMQALRSMRGWLQENRANRKTKSGIGKFVVAWLNREQDRAARPERLSYAERDRLQQQADAMVGSHGREPRLLTPEQEAAQKKELEENTLAVERWEKLKNGTLAVTPENTAWVKDMQARFARVKSLPKTDPRPGLFRKFLAQVPTSGMASAPEEAA